MKKLDAAEWIIVALVFIGLVSTLFFIYKPAAKVVAQPTPADTGPNQNVGLKYLLGNMPWAYQPWIGNAIPQSTGNVSGIVVPAGQSFGLFGA